MMEIKSCDVTFIENDFLSINDETKKNLEIYELQELDEVTPSFEEGRESQSHPEIAKDSGSDLPPNESVLLQSNSRGS